MGLRKFLCVAACLCLVPGLVNAQTITQADVDSERALLDDFIDTVFVDGRGVVAEDEMGAFYLKRPEWDSTAPPMDVPVSVASEDMEKASDALARMWDAWRKMNSESDDFTRLAAQAKAALQSGDAATSLGQKYYTFQGGYTRCQAADQDIWDFWAAITEFDDAVNDWCSCGLSY